ncbi:2422_t:CDS:2, partial [Racocetra fulgida]
PNNLTELGIAARFIYLNKTGYNGLYRVNSQGEFNVPFGQKEKVKLFDKENILAISKYLNKNEIQILNHDYRQILPLIKENDFLFVDPPYDSEKTILVNGLSVKQKGNGFNSYTADKFTQENQKELTQFLKKCEKQGAKWLLTNHATTQRFINCQGNKRVEGAQEIFIGNYQLTEQQKKEL